MTRNWFGQQFHATDSMVHWQRPYRETPEQFEAVWRELRADYDLIASLGPEYEKALERLLSAKYQEAVDDHYEDAAGEDM